MTATCMPLPGSRWHFQHGPIDIVIGADGEAAALDAAHAAARARFSTVLPELVAELPLLRSRIDPTKACPLRGPIARRMWSACQPHAARFITPMAAVAGAVAQELMAFYARPGIRRAWVNNGGDIALHLAPGESLRVGVYGDIAQLDGRQLQHGLSLDGRLAVQASDGFRGIATSGWRGRSFSMGIADAVTVLAETAAQADAAATVIGNAVNVEHPAILRRPANSLKDDSDLGDLLVTCGVPRLPPPSVATALAAGLRRAHELQLRGLIRGALLLCQGQAAQLAPAVVPKSRVLMEDGLMEEGLMEEGLREGLTA